MKASYIWVAGSLLTLAFLAGCEDQNKTVTTAPPEQPLAEEHQPYPPEPMTTPTPTPTPAPAPIAEATPTPPPPTDTYKPEAPVDSSRRLPPEHTTSTTRRPRPAPSDHYAAEAPARGQTYTVKKGDTLQEISKKFYGTTKKYNKIYQANKNKIKDPNKLSIGMKLTIPK